MPPYFFERSSLTEPRALQLALFNDSHITHFRICDKLEDFLHCLSLLPSPCEVSMENFYCHKYWYVLGSYMSGNAFVHGFHLFIIHLPDV